MAVAVDPARLQRLLGGEDVAWLVERARDRWSRGQPVGGTLRLARPTPAQREAMTALLGRRSRGEGPLGVRVTELEDVLRRAGAAPDLRSAVEALSGPVQDVAARRAAEEAAWTRACAPLDALVVARPALRGWVDRVGSQGLLRRLAASPQEALDLAARAAVVVAELPLERRELRGHLANRLLLDAHALDDGRELTTLVLGAAAALGGHRPEDGAATDATPDTGAGAGSSHPGSLRPGTAGGAVWRRRVWTSVGIAVGELAAPALALGLPGDVRSLTGRALGVWRSAGEPVHLTLRQLSTDPPLLPLDGRDVFVCENPSVVEIAADELGAGCAPLVCTHGQPSAAVGALLDLLAAAGGTLRHHGDFDWGGLRIASRVLDVWDAVPWRLGASDYEAAVAAAGGAGAAGAGGRRLGTAATASPWDPALATRMAEVGLAVEEEAVVGTLLADLAEGGGRAGG